MRKSFPARAVADRVSRRADISPEEFYRYWLNQSHTCEPELNQAFIASRGMAPAYDGVTEVWWNRIEDAKAAMASPVGAEAMAMLLKDEARFIDFSQSCVFMTTEHLIFDHQ